MQTARTIFLLTSALLAVGCNGEVMLLDSSGDGGGDAAQPDGQSQGNQGYQDAAKGSPDAAWWGDAPYEPDGVAYEDGSAPYLDAGWYDDAWAPYPDGSSYPVDAAADVICPIVGPGGNCYRTCCEAEPGGPAWTAVPVSLPCTYPDWVCEGPVDDAGPGVDDAGVGTGDAGCDHWCCEPPPGGRGYPTLECVEPGVTCTLPAADCEPSDAGWTD